MHVHVACPSCGRTTRVLARRRRREIVCPFCDATYALDAEPRGPAARVPDPTPAADDGPACQFAERLRTLRAQGELPFAPNPTLIPASTLRLADLDAPARVYLETVWRARGRGTPGVFLPPRRAVAFAKLLSGLLLVGAALALCAPGVVWQGWAYPQAVLLAVGLVLGFAGARALWPGRLGDFVCVDPLYLWEVRSGVIRVTPLGAVELAEAFPPEPGGAAWDTRVLMASPEGIVRLSLASPEAAERVVRFVNAAAALRRAAPGLAAEPARLAVLAGRLAAEAPHELGDPAAGRRAALALLAGPANDAPPAGPEIPLRLGRPAAPSPGVLARRVAAAAFLAAAALPAFLFVDEYLREEYLAAEARAAALTDAGPAQTYLREFPHGRYVDEVRGLREDRLFAAARAERGPSRLEEYLRRFPDGRHAGEARGLREDRLFARARQAPPTNPVPAEVYLREYPAGRHAAEARALRDRGRFARAAEAAAAGDATGLRRYLADPENVLHREEARGRLAGLYEQALDRLDKRVRTLDADTELGTGLIDLVRAVKGRDKPEVTVAFRATHQELPETPAQRQGEERALQAFRQELARKGMPPAGRDTVLPPGNVFQPALAHRREEMYLRQLGETLTRAVGPGLLEVRAAAPGEEPMITVAHDIRPSGRLTTYALSRKEDAPAGGKAREHLSRIVRAYVVDWTATLRPPGTGGEYVYRVWLEPPKDMSLVVGRTDPEWALYAARLASTAYSLSERLSRDLGLSPPAIPAKLSYREVAGQ